MKAKSFGLIREPVNMWNGSNRPYFMNGIIYTVEIRILDESTELPLLLYLPLDHTNPK